MVSPQEEALGTRERFKKRSASTYEVDDHEPTASTGKAKRLRTEYSYIGTDDEQSSRSDFQIPLSQIRIPQPRVPQSLDDFPSANLPLPAAISLHRLSRDFPNHLVGSGLRRFIEGNWRAKAVYSNMHPVAQKALASKGGWRVLQARFEEEKSRFDNERESTSSLSQTFPGHESAATTSAAKASTHTIQSLTSRTVPELDDLIRQELRKQRDVICGPVGYLSSSESDQRMMNMWGRQAYEWEAAFLAASNLGDGGLPPTQETLCGMLKRQNAIFKKAIYRRYPLQERASLDVHQDHVEIASQNARYLHLELLQQWSAGWQQSCAAGGNPLRKIRVNRGVELASHPGDWREYARNASQSVEDVKYPQRQRTRAVGCSTPHPRETSKLPLQQEHQHVPLQTHQSTPLQRLWHSKTDDHGYKAQAEGRQNEIGSGGVQGTQLPHMLGHINSMPSMVIAKNPNPILGRPIPPSVRTEDPGNAIPAQPLVNVMNQQHTVPNSHAQPATRKLGAPRKIMFTNAPSADSPLPTSAETDDDEILDHFPEHLSKVDVMKRFVRSSTTRPGGHPTNDMVDKLLQHVNASDFPDITENQRRANIRRWVVKERDAVNKKLKSGMRQQS